ncbi:MAG TPA: bifunctional diguanylate cyclase/phosphodiesterase [Steroidobacteraceae bacterium]|jgi:diguanylate cyclase (GGDEF)-like protein|nr:bifunctional diguanylate cyclase/phosphodiesterase [Steroidobacteraceae bacterium]
MSIALPAPRQGLRSAVRHAWQRRMGSWLTVSICTLLVALGGARLIVLSMRLHAQQARTATDAIATRAAQSLRAQLQELQVKATQRAQLATALPADTALPAALPQLGSTRGSFWMLPDGSVVGALPIDRAAAGDLAAEWHSTAAGAPPAAAGVGGVQVLGPLRIDSGWVVAVRAPLPAAASGAAAVPAGWAVEYRDLDELLSAAGLVQATHTGFDFELSQVDADTHREVQVTGSAVATMSDPVRADIGDWRLAMAPRAGWYPANDLIVDVSLVILVTWLVALGVRDTAQHMSQLRSALAVSRRRLQKSQHRLAEEVELRQRLQHNFEHAHQHDTVTGLPNRHYLISQLDRALRSLRTQTGRSLTLLLISLDRYKVITDTVGHTAGDELMVQITRLFGEALSGREHILARWNEDELALLLPDTPSSDVIFQIANELQQTLQNPIELRRNRVAAAINMGATFVESGLQRAEEVLREADLALSRAKAQGGSSLVIYSSAMQAQLMQEVSLEADLHSALERQEFKLMFQPIVDLRAHNVVGVEVLLRWMHPVEGLLGPGRFLSFAEEAGLIVPITRWIIRRACQLGGEWRLRVPPECDFYMSINLSPAVLLDPGLTDYVRKVLHDTSTAPASLKFELTENGLINNVGAARHVLDRLHGMGIELMLDDFGTGYSSLSHLQLFPFDYIKIDGPMDSRGSAEQGSGSLLQAMAQMASTLGLRMIGEIVETTSALKALEQVGCEFAQGNVFSAPLEAEQVVRCLRKPSLEPVDEKDEEDELSRTMILPVLPEFEIP